MDIVINREEITPDEDFGGVPVGAYGYVIEETATSVHVEWQFTEHHTIPNLDIEVARGTWADKSTVTPADQWMNTTHTV